MQQFLSSPQPDRFLTKPAQFLLWERGQFLVGISAVGERCACWPRVGSFVVSVIPSLCSTFRSSGSSPEGHRFKSYPRNQIKARQLNELTGFFMSKFVHAGSKRPIQEMLANTGLSDQVASLPACGGRAELRFILNSFVAALGL